MKAMEEPVIAATRTHRLADAAQGAAALPWRIAASSHGGLSVTLIAGDHRGHGRATQRPHAR
jgi:hypothetical protein